jgi:hypothetical protein
MAIERLGLIDRQPHVSTDEQNDSTSKKVKIAAVAVGIGTAATLIGREIYRDHDGSFSLNELAKSAAKVVAIGAGAGISGVLVLQ